MTADVNCDGRGSAADFTAAIIVDADDTQFTGCRYADPYRDQILTDADFLPILHDLFATFTTPFTPTSTATGFPTASPTASPIATRTGTPTVAPTAVATTTELPTSTATASPTPTATQTPTATATVTPTFTPVATKTRTPTRTSTATSTLRPTPTPTGLAYQLSGDWFANWTGKICFLAGQPFAHLNDVTYHVTAVDGRFDIQADTGERLGRGLAVDASGNVETMFTVVSNNVCAATGVLEEFQFDYKFTFQTNGTGTATADWSYGANTLCAVCQVTDTATLHRVAGPSG